MLILFDIDGTLLISHGQGMRAMEDAGRELTGRTFTIEGAKYSGCLDPLIWKQLCEINNVDNSDALHDQFRKTYYKHLRRRFNDGAPVTIMPGIHELLRELNSKEDITLGLVTGNYPETGQMKIETGGLDFSSFKIYGWGCDGTHRRDLPGVAMERFLAYQDILIEPERVIIIGDTPHDIDCAKFNGCRSLAVATGLYSMAELISHEPDHVVETLEDTSAIVSWLVSADSVQVESSS